MSITPSSKDMVSQEQSGFMTEDLTGACEMLRTSTRPEDRAIVALLRGLAQKHAQQEQQIATLTHRVVELENIVDRLEKQANEAETRFTQARTDLQRARANLLHAQEQYATRCNAEDQRIFALRDQLYALRNSALDLRIDSLKQRIQEIVQLQQATVGLTLVAGLISLMGVTSLLNISRSLRFVLNYLLSGYPMVPALEYRDRLEQERVQDVALLQCLCFMKEEPQATVDLILERYQESLEDPICKTLEEWLRARLTAYQLEILDIC